MPEAVGKHWSSICAQKVLLDFLNLRTNNAGQPYREEAIEKTILRIIASCAFSHSLAPLRSLLSTRGGGWGVLILDHK